MLQSTKILTSRFKVDPGKFELPRISADKAPTMRRMAAEERDKLGAEMAAYEKLAGERILLALEAMNDAEILAKIEDGAKLREETQRLIPAGQKIGEFIPELVELRHLFQALVALLSSIEGNESNEDLIKGIEARADEVRRKLDALFKQLGGIDYPFDHAQGNLTLQKFTIGYVPQARELGKLAQASEDMIGKMFGLYFRILGRLAFIAEKVEIAAGLPALPEPPEEVEKEEEAGAEK
jgi:hypothetical protein